MPRRHAVLALVVAVCWAVNFVVIDIGLESFPPLLFAALRFGLIAFPATFFVPRPDARPAGRDRRTEQCRQFVEVGLPGRGEAAQQVAHGAAGEPDEAGLAVHRLEASSCPMLEDHLGAVDPVAFLDVQQMTAHLVRRPGIRRLAPVQLHIREIRQHHLQHLRSLAQYFPEHCRRRTPCR